MQVDKTYDIFDKLVPGQPFLAPEPIPQIKSASAVVVYGAGFNGIDALKKLRAASIEPMAFCDANASIYGIDILGIPVISLEKLGSMPKDTAIVLTPLYFCVEIEKNLIDLGFNNIFLHPNIIDAYHAINSYRNNLEHKQSIAKDCKSKIEFVRERLEDEKSKMVFDSIMRLWLYGDFEPGMALAQNETYYPAGIIELNNDEVFVDCGAYIGDSITEFVSKTNKNFKAIYAFEADELNFEMAKRNISIEKIPNAHLHNTGVWEGRDTLKFQTLNTHGSHISNSGAGQIEVDSLDNILKEREFPVTFIKMDIEGAELEALRGAHEIIARDRPKLAICVYHKFGDLWEIPHFILTTFPGYKLYLRQNAIFFEFVCFAIPG
jgi:FkbM family methyltransferase